VLKKRRLLKNHFFLHGNVRLPQQCSWHSSLHQMWPPSCTDMSCTNHTATQYNIRDEQRPQTLLLYSPAMLTTCYLCHAAVHCANSWTAWRRLWTCHHIYQIISLMNA
jgi:hypothetical protein